MYPIIGAPRDSLHPGIGVLVMTATWSCIDLFGGRVEVIAIFDGRRNPATLEAIIRNA